MADNRRLENLLLAILRVDGSDMERKYSAKQADLKYYLCARLKKHIIEAGNTLQKDAKNIQSRVSAALRDELIAIVSFAFGVSELRRVSEEMREMNTLLHNIEKENSDGTDRDR